MVTILQGDALTELKKMPSESVYTCVTSPPYWGLRRYIDDDAPEKRHELGLEPTPEAYVANLVAVFREVWRVMRPDATLWLNLGDSYFASGQGYGDTKTTNKNHDGSRERVKPMWVDCGLKPKDLVGIPWRVAFALQADGWYLRADIIWHKPNPMPESVKDRCTKSHEYIFLLTKSAKYYYDAEAIKEQGSETTLPRMLRGVSDNHKNIDGAPGQTPHSMNQPRPNTRHSDKQRGHSRRHAGFNDQWDLMNKNEQCSAMRNKHSVWTVATQSFSDAHFATFPPALITPCILAGCPAQVCAKCGAPVKRIVKKSGGSIGHGSWTCHDEKDAERGMVQNQTEAKAKTTDGTYRVETLGFGSTCTCDAGTVSGTVLDPFAGTCTTGLVAEDRGRNSIMIELNPKYCEMAKRRTAQQGLFCR